MKLIKIVLILSFTLSAYAKNKQCEGQMSFIDDRIQLNLTYEVDTEDNRVSGEANILNTNTKTKFDLHCYNKIQDGKYFLCEARESYINTHLLVSLSGEVKLIRLNSDGKRYVQIAELWCDSERIRKLKERGEWELNRSF